MTTVIVLVIIILAIVGKVISTRRQSQRTTRQGWSIPATPEIPTGWAAFKCWCGNHSNALWLTGGWWCLILIVGMLVGKPWWDKVLSPVGLVTIAAFTLYGCMGANGPPFRHKLATIGIWFFIATSMWYVFGQKMWNDGVWSIFPSSAPVSTIPTPSEYIVEAPVGRWSEPIPTLHGEMIIPDPPGVLIRGADLQIHEDNGDGKVKEPIHRTPWVQIQSRTEPVKVTVSR